MTDSTAPARFPTACGALGAYEPKRVTAMAETLGPGITAVHCDATSVLVLDRAPLTWELADSRGFAWSEGVTRQRPVRSWREAACEWAACGLVIERSRRYLHTSVAGIAPIYYLQTMTATYFASRIDALVHAAVGPLSVDWDAWAAIFFFRHPLGTHTPFSEIRRMEPFTLLEGRPESAAAVRRSRWPWAEVEPKLSAHAGATRVVESARAAVRRLSAERILCPLSGGWDSRLLLCLLHAERPTSVVETFTSRLVSDEDGQLAPAVASALGVAHSVVDGTDDSFTSDFAESCWRMDYQWVSRAGFLPLAKRLHFERGLVTDGNSGGTLLHSRQIRDSMLRPGTDILTELWRTMTRPGAERVLSTSIVEALAASARRQLRAAIDRWQGHPVQAVLTTYLNRAVRGTSLSPAALLGHDIAVVMPFTHDEVARAALSVAPTEKLNARLYREVWALVNPLVGALPSTNDSDRVRSSEERAAAVRSSRISSPQAQRLYLWAAEHGALSPYLTARAKQDLAMRLHLRRRKGGANSFLRAVTVFALWHQRYHDRLRDIDPTAELE
jgi:asparagine synthetase B (glutamine-hydrolysing)